jgi:hypothetical protein
MGLFRNADATFGRCVYLFLNFGLHAILTGLVVVLTNHVAGATDDLHVFFRVSALLLVTVAALMIAHVMEIVSGQYS